MKAIGNNTKGTMTMDMVVEKDVAATVSKEIKPRTPEERFQHSISTAMSRQKRDIERSIATVVKQISGDMKVLAMLVRPHVEAFAASDGDASLPGRGHDAVEALMHGAPTRQSNGDGNGQPSCDAQEVDADSSPTQHGRAGHKSRDAQTTNVRPVVAPREPSAGHLAASRKVRGVVASDFWSRSIGGELKLGTATRFDFRQLGRKFIIGQHAVNRIVTELPWPNEDKATLKEIATEAQVKSILESSYQSLSAIDGYPNG